MNPEQFKAARRKLGLSQAKLAKLLGVSSARTVRRWEAGDRDIDRAAWDVVMHLARGEAPSDITRLEVSGPARVLVSWILTGKPPLA